MRKLLLLLLVLTNFILRAQTKDTPLLHFKISRIYCVFNLLETCKGVNGTSDALRAYISEATKTDTVFQQLIADYSALNLETLYQYMNFPETRPAYRSTKDLLIINAVQANGIDDFRQRVIGILHNTDYEQLIRVLQRADDFYEKIIWSKHGKSALQQLKNLERYQKVSAEAFNSLKRFYGSTWSDNVPFTVALTPVPGKDGATAATPHANTLCMDVLTEETNYATRIAIALHEICHVLYGEQNREMQNKLESYFAKNTSVYAGAAHNFFDEGVATAAGNGWTYKLLTGQLDTSGWYSDPYIDGFGHALFPLVSRYLTEKGTIDESFVAEAIRLFEERFPKAPDDMGIQFNHLTLYTDEEEPIARNEFKYDLYQQFTVAWLNFSSPVLGTESVSFLKESPGTQLILVDRDYEKKFTALQTILPELKSINFNLEEDFLISYYDGKKRLILIAKIKKGDTDKLFKAIKQRQFVNRREAYWRI